MSAALKLNRETFHLSRELDFLSERELTAQIGHGKDDWPLVLLKELLDNSLDACEDAPVAPEIAVTVDKDGITVTDNGPGMPPETVAGILDFSVRVSSREAYVSPTRGAQGNAWKTIIAMPFVIDGKQGRLAVEARGVRHDITLKVDPIRQKPLAAHPQTFSSVKIGTVVRVPYPCILLEQTRSRFLQIAHDFTFLNPHLTLSMDWFGKRTKVQATDSAWRKWLSSDPTCPHWYSPPERFERLVAAYLAHDADAGRERTVRALVAEFRGLTGSAKQKAVLDATGLARAGLSALRNGDGLDHQKVAALLDAMREHSKPVKPVQLGVIGKDHLAARFKGLGCEMESFEYRRLVGETDGLPWVAEAAFAWCPEADARSLITGVNWSPGIINPFRQLGKWQSLDSLLERQRAGADEPVVLLLHMVCPRVSYTDRGKSAVVIGGGEEE
jgi:DNA topoisomerase VI subunit B